VLIVTPLLHKLSLGHYLWVKQGLLYPQIVT
jgi:hypothetical protein